MPNEPAPERALKANEAFYEAFAQGDYASMARLWSTTERVICAHPGWAPVYGRDAVMGSWRAILKHGPTPITCDQPEVTVVGETAIIVCYERIADRVLVATNIFVQQQGVFRLVHHHAGPCSDPDVRTLMRPPDSQLN